MRETRFVSVLMFVCYAAGALGVSNAFPLSTFSMYSAAAPDSGARLVVKEEDGSYHEVKRYTQWSCEPELSFEMVEWTMCPDGKIGQPAGYLSKEALDHMRRYAGPPEAGEPVELIIRTWRMGEEIVSYDCAVARCRARFE